MGGFIFVVVLAVAGVALYVYLKGQPARRPPPTIAGRPQTPPISTARSSPSTLAEPPTANPASVALLEGRKLRSRLDLDAALDTLRTMVSTYRQQPYPDMPYLSFPRFSWQGGGLAPDVLVAFEGESSPRFVAFWRGESGTEAAMFDIDGELTMSEIGRWVMAGGQLTSIGTVPPGSLRLGAPQLPAGYQQDILAAADLPVTEHNLRLLDARIAEMFLIKAWQFITLDGKQDQAEADRFSQRWSASTLQEILDALASTKPDALPYLWDLPERVKGLLLVNPSTWRDDMSRSTDDRS